MSGSRFIDTNVLLAASSTVRAGPDAARALLEAEFARRNACLSGQVLREYLAVATRPAAANGLGLAREAALGNVRQILDRSVFLAEDARVRDALFTLLRAVPCLGKQVHDANITATMVAHGVRRLVTLNPADFTRFSAWIEVEGVAPAA